MPPPLSPAPFDARAVLDAVERPRAPARVVQAPDGSLGVTLDEASAFPTVALLPGIFPERLGERSFTEAHGLRFPYCTGAMANGIATTRLVIEVGRAGLLGFFGAAGLHRDRVAQAVDELVAAFEGTAHAWGVNLIHSPNEPALESAVADLLVARGVTRVEASAFMSLTPSVVRYACAGLRQLPDGRIARRHHVFAKVSRPEVARHFLAPAAEPILDALVREGRLTADEARLARHVAVAEDVTVEADSGGHTDNRPLTAVLPVILSLRDELAEKHRYARPVRVGAAGGIGTPGAAAAAFQLGAAYVLTGSVNQSAVESGLSEDGRAMLAQASLADVIMAPAADMFELGVKVQVLRRGTMFGTRALRLYDIFVAHEGIESMPRAVREKLEREVLGASLDAVWEETRAFWARRDPGEVERALANPKHRMALCFRWYLGMSSRWAIAGDRARKLDYQVWCGPAMGSFNDWVRGSFLEPPSARTAVQIARNILEGAAVITRAQQLRAAGVAVPARAFRFAPRPLS